MPIYPNTAETRVWSIENRAGPPNAPIYQGCWKAGSISRPKGAPTIVTCPSPTQFGAFEVVDKIPGELGLPEATITARYTQDASALLAILNRGCDIDLQMHIGRCKSPLDYLEGWDKILVLEAAQPGDYGVADFGALEQGDQNPINEEMPFRGEELYEILKMAYEEQAEVEAELEVIAIIVCDAISCGLCAVPSNGCDKVFALTASIGASPGGRAEIIYTADGGTTWGDRNITSLPVGRDPSDLACVGTNLIVISQDEDNLHYAAIAEILEETETWVAVALGFEATGSPIAIISLSPRHTWIVGENGYVYFTQDPTAGVTIQTAGTVTTEDLLAVHAYDLNNIVAVGENDAVIVTRDGGDTWAVPINTPNAGIDLTAVWMRGPDEWMIGCADGTLWYTLDAGLNWTQKVLPGQATITQIEDIKFSTPTVGWIAAKAAGTPEGRILRTINGGYEWYVAPEGNLSLPANDRINEIAICDVDPNIIYAGGLADDAADGIILKGSH